VDTDGPLCDFLVHVHVYDVAAAAASADVAYLVTFYLTLRWALALVAVEK
jgi:hypothetical protein